MAEIKEQLADKALEIITQIQHGVQSAGNFALEQLPDLAMQYVIYGRVSLTLALLIGIVLMVSSYRLVLKGLKVMDEKPYSDLGFSCFVAAFISGAVGILTTVGTLGETIMVWFAPKVWLIKELVNIIK